MATTNGQDVRYQRAKQRVEELKGFYRHLAAYLMVNLGLFLINYVASDNWWFYWPLLGWGIGLAAHAIVVFTMEGRFGRDWEERQIRELLEHDAR